MTETVFIKNKRETFKFKADLAITPDQQRAGLSKTPHIANNYAMVFMNDNEQETPMWMKDTSLSLDMIFVKKGGQIHRIEKNTKPYSEEYIWSNGPVFAVIEVLGGTCDRLNIQKHDWVNLPDIPSTS